MKNIISLSGLILILLAVGSASAQRVLTVKQFYEDKQDFTAKALAAKSGVVVAGNDTCALIIVKIPTVNDATFKPAKKYTYENGQYFVWVPANYARQIFIYTGDYEVLSYGFKEPLKPLSTYKMIIDVPQNVRVDTVRLDRKSKWSYDASLIVGQAVGVSQDFTISYFLIGVGADFFLNKTKGWTKQVTLFNSGYTGNFIREKKITLNCTCPHIFADVGLYFKYVSIACQVGLLFCNETLTELSYSGNGEGIQDEYVDYNWGEYGYHAFDVATTEKKKKYFTVSPLIKGYIPINSYFGLTIGAGYTFIPAVYAGAAWGSVGLHVKF